MKIAVLLVALALVPACDRDSPAAPTPAVGPYTGSWTGAVGDDINGTGTMRVELTELTIDAARSLLGGTWRTTFADSSRNAAGSIGGILSGNQLSITATPMPALTCAPLPLVPPGTFSITATVAGTELAGRYLFGTCTGSTSGTITLRRQ